MAGAFCEVYGSTIGNMVMEYLLENRGLDFAVGDKELGISRPKAYDVIKAFEKQGYACKSRVIGKTQLYLLDKDNERVKLFIKSFNECLRIIAEEKSAELLVAEARKCRRR